MGAPRVLLVSMRSPGDPMAGHERTCFARTCEVPEDHVTVHLVKVAPVTDADLAAVDGVVYGGSGDDSVLDDAPWGPTAVDALMRTIDSRKPTWASCFGFQAVARALGGPVVHDEAFTEIGTIELHLTPEGAEDPLMSALPSHFWAQAGHHDHVLSLPEGVTRLAVGQQPIEQAFRVDGTPFYASQFHPELTPDDLVHRFSFYVDNYFQAEQPGVEETIAALAAGHTTEAVPALLARLVRGGWV